MVYIFWLIIVVADQLIKSIIDRNFVAGQSMPVLNDIFHLTYVKNTGAVFGILQGRNVFFIISAIIIIIMAIVLFYIYGYRGKNIWFSLACGLILGGASGNLIDRIRAGYVIDYLDFRIWPVFNLADAVIVTGAGIIILLLLRGEEI